MPVPLSVIDTRPYERAVANALPSIDLRACFIRTVARHQGDLARMGVSAHLSGDLDGLARLAHAHRGDGFDLMPCVDPAIMPPGEALWVALAVGEAIVATTAAVYRYIPAGRRLRDGIEDMSLFYAAPGVARGHGAAASCRAPLADAIGGHVVLLAAGWVHPAWRGKKLIGPTVRLAALAAYARWSPDWVAGLVEAKFSQALVVDLYGFLRRDGGVSLTVPGWPGLDFTLVAASRAEFERETVNYCPRPYVPAPGDYRSAAAHWGRVEAAAAE